MVDYKCFRAELISKVHRSFLCSSLTFKGGHVFTGELISIKIADVMRGNNTFVYTGDDSDKSTWPGKVTMYLYNQSIL